MTSIKEQIGEILLQRHPRSDQITTMMTQLTRLSQAFLDLDKSKAELMLNPESEDTNIGALNFSHIHQQINQVQNKFDKIKARFSRKTLNIAVIGRARQGKSRFLQSLTGLSSDVIPDGNRQHCTGVKSHIFHRAGIETHAEVIFHTEQSFLEEVIAPYYNKLTLGPAPTTIDQFIAQKLDNSQTGATRGAQFEHLLKYHLHCREYRDLLRHATTLRITREQIPEYVAQHSLNDPDLVYNNYMAVREVSIYCEFPNIQTENIALIDMPGLGDTGIGDESRLIRSLSEEVDAIVFIRMPKPTGDHWADVDVQLYDTACESLPEIPLEQWSFMVLNRYQDDSNTKNCMDLWNTIQKKHIQTAETIIANCADAEEAQERVLRKVLDYLANHMVALDQKYMEAIQQIFGELKNSCRKEISVARGAVTKTQGSSDELRVFDPLFDEYWENLTNNLENLLEELRAKRSDDDINFKQAIDASLNNARQDTAIPALEDARRFSIASGGVEKAYTDYLHTIRTRLTQHFQDLDQGLHASVQETRDKVSKVLATSGLASLSKSSDRDFLEQIKDLVSMDQGLPTLQQGFRQLLEFELLFRGMVQHRIREHLDDLDRNTTTFLLGKEPKVEVMIENLRDAHAEVLYKLEAPLRNLQWEPSMANFAVLEEFMDRILWAKSAKQEWRYFMSSHKGTLWPVKFRWHALLTKIEHDIASIFQ